MSPVAAGVRDALVITAKDLLDGSTRDQISSEYIRGMVELIANATLSNEDSDVAYANVEAQVLEALT